MSHPALPDARQLCCRYRAAVNPGEIKASENGVVVRLTASVRMWIVALQETEEPAKYSLINSSNQSHVCIDYIPRGNEKTVAIALNEICCFKS